METGETPREPVYPESPLPLTVNFLKHGVPVAWSPVIQYLQRVNTVTWKIRFGANGDLHDGLPRIIKRTKTTSWGPILIQV